MIQLCHCKCDHATRSKDEMLKFHMQIASNHLISAYKENRMHKCVWWLGG